MLRTVQENVFISNRTQTHPDSTSNQTQDSLTQLSEGQNVIDQYLRQFQIEMRRKLQAIEDSMTDVTKVVYDMRLCKSGVDVVLRRAEI
jgi:hypothetical protein